MDFNDTPLLSGLINVIKFVRSCSTLGLADCKYLVENWAEAYNIKDYQVYHFDHVVQLLKGVGKVVRGEWVIEGHSIRISKNISRSDWANI